MPKETLYRPSTTENDTSDRTTQDVDHTTLGTLSVMADPAFQIHNEFRSVSARPDSTLAPQFLRQFSKDNSSEERSQIAKELWALKSSQSQEVGATALKTERLKISIEERVSSLQESLHEIQSLETELDAVSGSRLKKLLNYLQFRKLEKLNQTYDDLNQQQQADLQSKEDLANLHASQENKVRSEIKGVLQEFYKTEAKKWAQFEYAEADISALFSEEHLASLSLDEYVLLLKRFPSHMVAHVTRQGIRDHLGHMYHSAGENEYSDSFLRMLRDGRLRSPLGVYLADEAKELALAEFLQLDTLTTKEEAWENLTNLMEPEEYSDRMAVHFATEEVADMYYGSERGNEIFVTYPSAFIASQYYFNGQLSESGGGYWNDQWVWANEEHGLDLDAAVVFIPSDTKVDSKTGSRYQMDESLSPIVNHELRESVKKIIESPDFNALIESKYKLPEKFNFNRGDWDWAEKGFNGNSEVGSVMRGLTEKLSNDFGITDKKTQLAILNTEFLTGLNSIKHSYDRGAHDYLDGHLKKMGMFYLHAKDRIPSQQFWENYFGQHPGDRPSKLVYYKGDSPTDALGEWKSTSGMHKRSHDPDMGFANRSVRRDSEQAMAGNNRFRDLAQEVIENFYAQKESANVTSNPVSAINLL